MNEILTNKGLTKAGRLKRLLNKDKPLRRETCQVCREEIWFDESGEIVKGCWCKEK